MTTNALREPCVLVVEDEPSVRQALAAVLEPYSPLVAADGIEARDILRDTLVDVVVCDLSMPRLDGLSLMRWAKEHAAHPIWIVLSAHDTFDTAVQAMQLGAFDFLQKPLASSAVLETVVANALRQQALVAEQARLRQDLAETNLRVAEALSRVQAAYQVLLEQRAMVEQDFRRAERIQRALLPRVLPRLDGVQVNVAFRPSTVIGGDLYGADMLDDRHLAVYVADAAGHGVSAALLIVLFNQRLRTKDEAGPRSPAAVLADLNRDLHRECSASGLFITVAYALIDTVTHEIRISSAGHPSCLVLREDGSSVSVETTGPALGLTPDATFGETRLFSGEGDRLLFHTDGLTQALPPGAPPLASLVRAAIADGCDGATTVDRLLAWTDGETAERGDDVTILLVTARSGASTMNARTSEAPPAPRAADSPLSTVTVSDTTFVAVRGRGTWTHGPSLQETCVEALDAGRRVVVDLGACVSLDSTLLGTLYALARRAEERGAFHLQNVPGDVRRAFVELSLEPVLAAISDEPVPLGDDMMPLRAKDDRTAQDLLLHAHEILAAITPGNATEFGGVVEALRAASPP